MVSHGQTRVKIPLIDLALLAIFLFLVNLFFHSRHLLRLVLSLIFLALFLFRRPRWLGPLFLYDLMRTSRRNPHIPLRCLYGSLLLAMLFLLYSRWFPGALSRWEGWFRGGMVPINLMPRYAKFFFHTFLSLQLAVVGLVTPALTAGAISGERERRTLDYLLTTPLTAWEILVGLLASRVSGLALLLLTGLPVLAMMQMFGGVDLDLVLAAFADTLVTLVSLGSLCLWVSIHSPTSQAAYFLAYYLGFLFLLFTQIPIVLVGPWPRNLETLVDLTIFNGFLAFLFISLSAASLRGPPCFAPPSPHEKKSSGADPKKKERGQATPKPPVSDRPMRWKEFYVEHRLFLAGGMLIWPSGFFVMILALVYKSLSIATAHVAFILFLLGALRASGGISREREQQTLDSLLVTPMERDEILLAKFLASFLFLWGGLLGVGVFYGTGICVGLIHLLALPLLLAGWCVYAAFLVCLGLCFSLLCRTAVRSRVWTLVAVLAFLAVFYTFSYDSEADFRRPSFPSDFPMLDRFLLLGLSPLRTLAVLAFRSEDLFHESGLKNILAALEGVFCYAIAAMALWQGNRFLFRRQTGGGAWIPWAKKNTPARLPLPSQ